MSPRPRAGIVSVKTAPILSATRIGLRKARIALIEYQQLPLFTPDISVAGGGGCVPKRSTMPSSIGGCFQFRGRPVHRVRRYTAPSASTAYRPLTAAKLRLDFESFRKANCHLISIGEPGGTRTRDPMIKSHVLYRLSYGLFQKDCALRQRRDVPLAWARV